MWSPADDRRPEMGKHRGTEGTERWVRVDFHVRRESDVPSDEVGGVVDLVKDGG